MTETPIRPIRQNDLSKAGFAFLAGGRYINPMTREDYTGRPSRVALSAWKAPTRASWFTARQLQNRLPEMG